MTISHFRSKSVFIQSILLVDKGACRDSISIFIIEHSYKVLVDQFLDAEICT